MSIIAAGEQDLLLIGILYELQGLRCLGVLIFYDRVGERVSR